jgi:hypothetical protein
MIDEAMLLAVQQQMAQQAAFAQIPDPVKRVRERLYVFIHLSLYSTRD